jgi:phage terminase large subunit
VDTAACRGADEVTLGAAFRDRFRDVVPSNGINYQRHPIAWARDVLGISENSIRWSTNPGYDVHSWDGTPDPLALVAESLADGSDVAVESGTGTGKTFEGGWIVLWFLDCFEDSIVVTSAPKEQQLSLHIWKEIGRLWPRFAKRRPGAQLLDLKIRMKPTADDKETWAAVGFACGVDAGAESATRAQGFHAEHMLIITEETPGIKPAIMTAFENTCTANHNLRLAFGNPDHQQDALHQFALSPGVVHIRVSALDHPNVVGGREIIPGAVTRKAIDRRRIKYGESSRLFQSRVRGISPAEAADALILESWCTLAQNRQLDLTLRVGPPAWGVDVANSEAGDKGAIARGHGACLLEVTTKACPDANVLGAEVVAEVRATKGGLRQHVGVDSVGVGAGTVNEAKRLGMLVQALNGGAKAWPTQDENLDVEPDGKQVTNEEKFGNLRAQMWWQMREDLRMGRIALPSDTELVRDLVTPTWRTKNGVIWVESKEDIKVRLGRSPDKGDAAVYWNWVRDRTRAKPEEPEESAFSPAMLEAHAEQSQKPLLHRMKRRRAGLGGGYTGGY